MAERVLVSNRLGQLTDRRLIIERARGFGSVHRQDIPIRSLLAVDTVTERHQAIAAVFAVGAVALGVRGGAAVLIAAFAALFAYLLWSGYPQVIVRLHDGGERRFRVWPWQARDAAAFAEAIRDQLARRSDGPDI